MAKMNELPCIRSGRRVYINVEQALAILDERSMERVVRHPIGATVITPERLGQFKGRVPDAIRKLREAQR